MHSIPWCRLLSLDIISPFRHTPAMHSLRQTATRPICTRCRPLPVPTKLRPPHPTVSNRQFDIRQCYLWPRTPMLWPHNQSNEIYWKTTVKPIGNDDKKKYLPLSCGRKFVCTFYVLVTNRFDASQAHFVRIRSIVQLYANQKQNIKIKMSKNRN